MINKELCTCKEYTVSMVKNMCDEFSTLSYWQAMRICELLAGVCENHESIDGLKDEISTLEDELDDAEDENSYLQGKVDSLRAENEELKNRIKELENASNK